MNATRNETETPALSTGLMRAQASWFLDQRMLPRHQTVKGFGEDFRGYLRQLIPRIEQLADVLPPDDVPAKVALAAVGEARRRLDEAESTGLHGEVERVRRLARSVVALCDHYDALTGVAMCLACDKPIEAGDAWVPYDRSAPPAAPPLGRVGSTAAARTPHAAADAAPCPGEGPHGDRRARVRTHRRPSRWCPARPRRDGSSTSVRPVPVSWLAALRPGGRLVATIAGTGLILTADKTDNGGAVGRIEPDAAGFVRTRHGEDYDDPASHVWDVALEQEGEEVATCRYPLLNPQDSWGVMSMLGLQVLGIDCRYREDDLDRVAAAPRRLLGACHGDRVPRRVSSSARRPCTRAAPRRLWREVQRVRSRLDREGELPVYGAWVTITPDGETTLSRGAWSATL
ncbi:DUF6415 family natural product biosynthesis protein [Streptomyces sp. F001]|uniref:DUF6415 family natural product biosynthesis protein n=1 Tax=Streptomyces sp. F001 TaxID=1510026 RepID=UPI0019D11399|nr:DUF6415 family natural product biosynthesis protein [Streptomyces sp. F001]